MTIQRATRQIRKAILNSGMQKTAIAKKSGVSRITVHNVIRQAHQPTIASIGKLAKALNVRINLQLN